LITIFSRLFPVKPGNPWGRRLPARLNSVVESARSEVRCGTVVGTRGGSDGNTIRSQGRGSGQRRDARTRHPADPRSGDL